jgi:GTP-binding protein
MDKAQPHPPQPVDARFLGEARDAKSLPAPGPPEIAIAGRSNVGKSTLLNRLAGRRALARTSKTPGRTRGLIFYQLQVRLGGGAPPTAMRVVDLPGYGYAKVSQAERTSWQGLVEGYVERRHTLRLVLVLIDARRGVEDDDVQLLEWLSALGRAAALVVTKIDKLSSGEQKRLAMAARDALGAGGPPVLLVSGQTGEGVDRLWLAIARAVEGPEGA